MSIPHVSGTVLVSAVVSKLDSFCFHEADRLVGEPNIKPRDPFVRV